MNHLSINAYICPPEFRIANFLSCAAQAGAAAVGLTLRAIDEIPISELRLRLHDLGLLVSSLNSAGYFLYSDTSQVRAQSDTNLRLIDAAAELGASTLVVITGGLAHGTRPLTEARTRIQEGLQALAERASRSGVELGLEPIHPAGVLNKGCVNSLTHAFDLVDPLPNVSIALDLYHSWWDPYLPTLSQFHRNKLRLVQFCNVVAIRDPADLQRESPEAGLIDVAAALHNLVEGGYQGYFEYELFAEHLRGRNVQAMINLASQFYSRLDRLVLTRAAGSQGL